MASATFDLSGTGAPSGNWTTPAGSWERFSGSAKSTAGEPTISLYTGVTWAADTDTSITLGVFSSGFQIPYRMTTGLNGYVLAGSGTGGGDLYIHSLAAGTHTAVTSRGFSWSGGEVVRVLNVGNSHKIYVNGVLALDITSSTYLSGGSTGIGFLDATTTIVAGSAADVGGGDPPPAGGSLIHLIKGFAGGFGGFNGGR